MIDPDITGDPPAPDEAEATPATLCIPACWAQADCAVCKRRKSPRGRSVPMEAANGYCCMDCPGYWQEPHVGHLWPGEPGDPIR